MYHRRGEANLGKVHHQELDLKNNVKRPASTGGYQSAKQTKASGIKCFFKPKSSATPSLSTTESPSSGRASAVPDPLQVPDNPTVPHPPLPTPESPSSARASAVPDPIQVPDDPTVPDPPLPTPESPSSARASEVPDPNQVPDDSTVPDPPLPTPESPSSARASAVPDPIQVSDDSTAPDPEVTTPASVEEISESPYHPDLTLSSYRQRRQPLRIYTFSGSGLENILGCLTIQLSEGLSVISCSIILIHI